MKLARHDLESLRAAVIAGERFKFLFFWGHRGSGRGVRQECLSQWYESPFSVEGVSFVTAEHYMMHRKAHLFGDVETARRILAAPTPGAAKALGRAVSGFDDQIWERHRREIVTTGNLAKFSQSERLASFLLSTHDRVLVEASPVDRIWGIGLAVGDEEVENPLNWRGPNLLGFALMDVREALREKAV